MSVVKREINCEVFKKIQLGQSYDDTADGDDDNVDAYNDANEVDDVDDDANYRKAIAPITSFACVYTDFQTQLNKIPTRILNYPKSFLLTYSHPRFHKSPQISSSTILLKGKYKNYRQIVVLVSLAGGISSEKF